MFTDDANKDKYNDLAKNVCKLEHGFMLGHDIVKDAAKQTTVDSFDQVSTADKLQVKKLSLIFVVFLTFYCF